MLYFKFYLGNENHKKFHSQGNLETFYVLTLWQWIYFEQYVIIYMLIFLKLMCECSFLWSQHCILKLCKNQLGENPSICEVNLLVLFDWSWMTGTAAKSSVVTNRENEMIDMLKYVFPVTANKTKYNWFGVVWKLWATRKHWPPVCGPLYGPVHRPLLRTPPPPMEHPKK